MHKIGCGAVTVGVVTRWSVIEEVVVDVNLSKLAHELKLGGAADVASEKSLLT
ncbi:hypothetical protein ABIE18_003924 [Arthrobacter sp. 2762]